ncbi:hypothetical protein LAZ40_02135 [Cereibacter sphaeroides]|uniref:hypothetical protein n=1 Tax=Cereibacter sphaeroides TaxID=1063 RepID=UPI001F47B671|nr:hypothetical protein [Cereibacter sphaeroides]MCE6957856.1 hypothetical protein [Cereibacter sphaeroides]MCE6971825.1 hypothetical protein [Cereibacter sphaeroides]
MNDDFSTDPSGFGPTRGIERVRPAPRPGLRKDEIAAKKRGNYIFSFGFPGSGKTTFQWFLMNYIMNEGDWRSTIDVPDTTNGPDWGGRRIINEWKEQWITGRFPEPNKTAESDIREVTAKVATVSGRRIELDFSFLEVSGELLKMVLPLENRNPQLSESIQAYFANPGFRSVLMLMLHPDVEENDKLFPSLITYLDKEFPGLRSRLSLGVIISKPEASLQRLRTYGSVDGRFDYDTLDELALEDYLNRFCGETYQIWRDWPGKDRTLLAPLHLGEIDTKGEEPLLVRPDYRHIEAIFHWIVEQFTGQRPGPTFLDMLKGRMSWR